MADEQDKSWMGSNRGMTAEEINAFLAGPVVARIATVDEEGAPYITPVWQHWDGQFMWIIPRAKTLFVQHLKKNPKVAVSCALDSGTYTRVLYRGTAEIVFGPGLLTGEWLEIANKMATRYLGEHGPEYLVPSLDRPRYVVKFTPTWSVSWDGIEWAQYYKT